MVSVVSAPVIARFPYWSSLDTLKVVSGVSAPAVVGGAVVKASLVTAPAVTVTVALAVPPAVVSVATSAQEPVLALLRMMLVNVAVPVAPDVVVVRLPFGDNVQFVEESVMVSPVPAAE
jgi:hypothetical protein